MKNFASFLTEATVGSGDIYRASTKIVEYLAKKIGQEYTELDGQSYTNSSGNYFGFFFFFKTDNSAIRVGKVTSSIPSTFGLTGIMTLTQQKKSS